MSISKSELFHSYFTPEDPDDAAVDFCGYAAWSEAVELPEMAAPERPARAYDSFQAMLDACEDENGCVLCGDKLDEPNALMCADCRAETLAQIEEATNHVN